MPNALWCCGDLTYFQVRKQDCFNAVVTSVLLFLRVDGWRVTWAGEVTVKQQPFTPWGQADVNTNKPGAGTHSFSPKTQRCTYKQKNPDLEKSHKLIQILFNLAHSRVWFNNALIIVYFYYENFKYYLSMKHISYGLVEEFGWGCDDASLKWGGSPLQNSQTTSLDAAWLPSPSHTEMLTSSTHTHTNTVHACFRWADGEKSGVCHKPPTLSTSALVAAQALIFPT